MIFSNANTNFATFLPWFLSLNLVQPSHSGEVGQGAYSTQRDKAGPLEVLYQWKQLDYAYPSEMERNIDISTGDYNPANNLPLGLDVWKDRVFVTVPRWKKGVPATLGWLPRTPRELSPKINPYPSWDWHASSESCNPNVLTSVFRIFADQCGRLWVLDSGSVEVITNPRQICPPSVFIFDLNSDKLILRYEIPADLVKEDSLFTNIVVDVRNNQCEDAHAYITDVWRYGILVFRLKDQSSYRVTHGLFYPDPIFTKYTLGDLDFRWNDGIFGMALSPPGRRDNDRILYYHPMSSSNEFYIKTSLLRNETAFNNEVDAAKVMGESRGPNGHSSASGMDRRGVMFFNMVTRNSLGCWDSRKPYLRATVGIVAQDNDTLVFPNDLKVDQDERQSVWVLSNKLPFYLYRSLDANETNFRILRGFTEEIVRDSVCDPHLPFDQSAINTQVTCH